MRLQGKWRRLALASLGVDAVALALALGGSAYLQQDVTPLNAVTEGRTYALASAVMVPVFLLLFRMNGLYDVEAGTSGPREYTRVAHAAAYGILLILTASFFY